MKHVSLSFAAALLLISCARAPLDEDVGRSSSSAAASSVASAPAGWLTYENAEYGVSFHYPSHFGELHAGAEAFGKNAGLRIEDGAWTYDKQVFPLLSLQGENIDPTFSHALHVEAFPLEGYSRVLMYDDEYNYDPATGTWTTTIGGVQKELKRATIGGRTAYEFPFGDAGSSAITFAIPLHEKGVVLEITFSACVACLVGGTDMTDDQAAIDANVEHLAEEQRMMLESVRFE